jgi:hypothetical protein
MKYRIKNTKTTLLIISIYQIIGGLFGLGAIAWILLRTSTINGVLLLIFFIAVGLYSFSIKSGCVLLRKDYKRGLIFSIINQFIQIISIAIGGFKYSYYSGGMIDIGFNFTDGFKFNFDFGLISKFNFAINVDEKDYFLYVNILAIFLLKVLFDLYRELKVNDWQVIDSDLVMSNIEIKENTTA